MNETIMERSRNPRHKGLLDEGHALRRHASNPLCGDSLSLDVAVQATDGNALGATVTDVRWDGYACALCAASADALAELAIGRSVAEAAALGPDDVARALSNVEPKRSRRNCLELPLTVFKEALESYEH